jgi:hypothetical protein
LSTINVHVVPVFSNQSVALKPTDAEYVPCGGLIEGRNWVGRQIGGNLVCLAVAPAKDTAYGAIERSTTVTAETTSFVAL